MPAFDREPPSSAEPLRSRSSFDSEQRWAAASWWFSVTVVFLLFAVYAFIRSPIPGVNEPHYLAKAKHLADPAWCPRDVFLDSADAHFVFLWLFSLPTKVLSLDATAVLGRIAVWTCLSIGWCRLAGVTFRPQCGHPASPWPIIGSAGIFLGLSALGSFSGEWIIGGVEAKGFAWAALWMALAEVAESRLERSAFWCGLSVTWHPVVGVWGTLACIGASFAQETSDQGFRTDSWKQALRALAVWALASLPGLIPAVAMLLNADPQAAAEANRIQVIVRLGHHLDPRVFPAWNWQLTFLELASVLVLFASWLWQRRASVADEFLRRQSLQSLWGGFGTSLAIALIGLYVGFGPRILGLMKFYPFRIFDGLLPAVLALTFVSALIRVPTARLFVLIAGLLGLAAALALPAPETTGLTKAELKDWVAMCRWISRNTPTDAQFVTPRYTYAFKWYAHRGEYVANKDMPQDAASLVEWQRRREWLAAWRKRAIPSHYAPPYLVELRRETRCEYFVAIRGAVEGQTAVYENETFLVYRCPTAVQRAR